MTIIAGSNWIGLLFSFPLAERNLLRLLTYKYICLEYILV